MLASFSAIRTWIACLCKLEQWGTSGHLQNGAFELVARGAATQTTTAHTGTHTLVSAGKPTCSPKQYSTAAATTAADWVPVV
jgi:hypothetical protein